MSSESIVVLCKKNIYIYVYIYYFTQFFELCAFDKLCSFRCELCWSVRLLKRFSNPTVKIKTRIFIDRNHFARQITCIYIHCILFLDLFDKFPQPLWNIRLRWQNTILLVLKRRTCEIFAPFLCQVDTRWPSLVTGGWSLVGSGWTQQSILVNLIPVFRCIYFLQCPVVFFYQLK